MSKPTVELAEIVLRVKGKEIHLSADEARELRAVLDDILDKKEVQVVPYPYPVPYPRPRPYWIVEPWYGPIYGNISVSDVGNTSAYTITLESTAQ